MGSESDPLGAWPVITRAAFLEGLAKALEWEDAVLSETTVLRGNEHWDSMGKVATMLFLDEDVGFTATDAELEAIATVGDLLVLAGERLDR